VLDRALGAYYQTKSAQRLDTDTDTDTVLGRVWRALLVLDDVDAAPLPRRIALRSAFLAENDTGLPLG